MLPPHGDWVTEARQTQAKMRVALLRYFIKHRKMADVKRQCDLELVSDSFSRCLKDDRDVLIDPFLVGYDELCRYARKH